MCFKIGQTVQIRSDLSLKVYDHAVAFTAPMLKLLGLKAQIVDIVDPKIFIGATAPVYRIYIPSLNINKWYWAESMLLPVKSKLLIF